MALRRARRKTGGGVSGTAKVGKRTKDLTKRLEPGDIAVIDHADLDRVVELSRMLSGQPASDTARGHAEELLATAAALSARPAGPPDEKTADG